MARGFAEPKNPQDWNPAILEPAGFQSWSDAIYSIHAVYCHCIVTVLSILSSLMFL